MCVLTAFFVTQGFAGTVITGVEVVNTVFVVVTVFAFTVVAWGTRTPRQEQAEEYASLFLHVAAHCGVLVALRVVALQPLRSSSSRFSSGGMPVTVVTEVVVVVEVVTVVIVTGSVLSEAISKLEAHVFEQASCFRDRNRTWCP